MESKLLVHCPKCGFDFDADEALKRQYEVQYRTQLKESLAVEKQKYDAEFEKLNQQKEEFEQKKQRENELFAEKLQSKLKEQSQVLEQQLKARLQIENAEALALMQKELAEQSEKVKELGRSKAEIEKLKREKEEIRDKLAAEAEKTFNQKLAEERERIKLVETERNELRIKELIKQLDDQKKLTEEMKRKQEQGSMQLQGEVQELAIEDWLRSSFQLDTIEEIRKGVRGGDCIQIVNTHTMTNCGTIYYESKRTKDFQPAWIAKFKDDIREKGANVGVLVTEVMPSDMDRLGMKDGIWICTYEEFKGLSKVLRESLVQISLAIRSQENKGDKMHLLYDFLTSNTFRLQIEAIVEGFTQMRSDLEKEKRAMQSIWKTREKQLDKVLDNTIDMYGSIKGIAGSAIGEIKALELPEGDIASPIDEP